MNLPSKTRAGSDERPGALLGAWALAFLSAFVLTVLLLRPIWDSDIFWQLKLGELALSHGGLIRTEPFSAHHLGEPLPSVGWLAQILSAKLRLLTGWTGLRIFDAVCWLGGFLCVAAACRRRGSSAAGLAVALAVAFYIAFPTASIRPQTFAVLIFGIILAMLQLELKPWRTLQIAAPLLLLWQNLHPSVSLAAIVFGTYAAVDWIKFFLSKQQPPWEMTILAALSVGAMFATPDGFSILRISADNAASATAMGVTEWLPIWHPAMHASIQSFALASAAVAGAGVIAYRRIDPRALALALAILGLIALANRFVVFLAISIIPVIARALTRPGNPSASLGLQTPLLLLVAAISTPLQFPTQFKKELAVDAVQALHKQAGPGVVFSHPPFGGALIDVGYPGWQVAYDGRFYRYTPEEWRFYKDIDQDKVPLTEVERRYHPVAFLLNPQWNSSLISELSASPNWRRIWSDDVAVGFVPQTQANRP